MPARSPRIVSISPGLPFLPTLARGILDGRFVEETRARGGDPLSLASVTVLVPTRRAARALAEEFARQFGAPAAILPRIRPLGDPDEAEAVIGASEGSLTPEMDPLERRLLLARLVRVWKESLNEESLRVMAGEALVLPASAADALYLADDLAAFLDEATSDEAALAGLATLAPDRLAHWWQLTLRFLAIVAEQWPALLAERGLVDPAGAQVLRLRREAERLRREGSPGAPIILAGSTATAPATLDFMAAVAHLPNGALVLPGLDTHLDATSFDSIDRARSLAAPGHAQYGLKRILQRLLVDRSAVEILAPPPDSPCGRRERFLSEAFRPAETTDRWRTVAVDDEAVEDLELIEAADEREEALAVAVAIRDALGRGSRTVALTTPDRNLARRVVAELERFGIGANDSAGRPLLATAPGTLARLALEVALEPGDPVTLVSLLKHPLVRLGLDPAEARRAARTVELVALRGGTGRASAGALAALYRERLGALEAEDARVPRAVALLGEEDRERGARLCEALEEALAPLAALARERPVETAVFAERLTRALEALAAEPGGGFGELYAEEAGAALASLLSGLVAAPPVGFAVAPAEWPDAFAALAAGTAVRPRAGLSARAFVWGALEARLQDVDVMILGGLNEGTWPQGARSDAFLSRIMRAEILLDPPERRIGLAAHDVWMAMGNARVVMTRAVRAGGAPTVASRWLQRLLTLAGKQGAARLREAGTPFLACAARLDDAAEAPRAVRPEPRPPLHLRPRRFSVTEVERLFRDPYAVYAKRILALEPLEPLIRAPDAAERGTLYHRILARFAREVPEPGGEDAEAALLAIARTEFAAEALPPDIEAVWWPRMVALAPRVVDWERGRGSRVLLRHAEAKGRLDVPVIGVTLTGEADRIDVMEDGSVEILDFKTGSQPSVKQARTLLSPQLALEAAMARAGAFEGVEAASSVAELWYIRLRERSFREDRLSQTGTGTREAVTADGLADEALTRFKGLAAHFLNEANGYRSRARPMRNGDFSGAYDHLARAREWALGEDDDAGEGEEA